MRVFLFCFLFLIMVRIPGLAQVGTLVVTSPAFQNNGVIPSKYSCVGSAFSPPINITNIPTGTQSLAIIMHDPDAPDKGGFTHWVMWNVDTSGVIVENFASNYMGMNTAHQVGYAAICPPNGTHHYHIYAYALDVKLNAPSNTDDTKLRRLMAGHILARGELMGTFNKSYRK